MKNLFLSTLILATLTISCSSKQENKSEESFSSISVHEDISITEFNTTYAQADSNTIILDVRTDNEFKAGAIPNSLQLDFMSPDFKSKVAQLDSTRTYIVYCQSGGRSTAASKIMAQELGFTDVKNLEGGYSTWSKSE
ncbi:MAG: hypothetical protein BalsKO_05910 [Balneolaceae bacterium]